MAVAASPIELTRRSATALAAAIREGETTSREVVEAHLELLSRVQERINPLAAERFDAARREADAADERVGRGGDLPPLLGVPCTIKESIGVAGMPQCAGIVARRDRRAARTAPAAARLLDAGAICLGVTNISEATMWIESDNRVYGRTSNAYDPSRTAGGSSGGEGAAVGSGGAPIGLGSDIGGSIRLPAFFNGVFGHKGSPGLVPLTGNFPDAHREARRMLVVGPLARRAEDLMPVLEILAGPDGEDETAVAMELGDPARVSLHGLDVVLSEDAWFVPVRRELRDAREQAAGALAAAGARVRRESMRDLRRALELYLAALQDGDAPSMRELLAAEGAAPVRVREAFRRNGDHTVPTAMLVASEGLAKLVPDGMARRALAAGRALAEEAAETIGDGVLLHPPFARVAPKHGKTVGRTWVITHAAVFNLLGTPVTQVPLGLNSDGVPVGVQVVARPGADHVTIAVALELERVFGGWTPPPAF